ncbi:hypothetical protein AUP07_0905 [methanogenic archaeon mixed culture ISO4-G1]|nr:hypothetical protein AUP07_0905 [methanogenic archaeon mixed culture ISO4-G1]
MVIRIVHRHDGLNSGIRKGLICLLRERRSAVHLDHDLPAFRGRIPDEDYRRAVAPGGHPGLRLLHEGVDDVLECLRLRLLHLPDHELLDHVVRGGVYVEEGDVQHACRIHRLVVVVALHPAEDLVHALLHELAGLLIRDPHVGEHGRHLHHDLREARLRCAVRVVGDDRIDPLPLLPQPVRQHDLCRRDVYAPHEPLGIQLLGLLRTV